MQWMLLVDTCGAQGSVGIADLRGTLPVIAAERALPGRETQERLMVAIPEVLAETGVDLQRLDVLTVVTGPGSFTGVRIGLAAVKGLAEALGRPVVALSRLAILAAAAGEQRVVHAWIDAGRGDVFTGTYRDGRCLSERMMHGSHAAAEAQDGDLIVVMEDGLAALHPRARLVPPPGLGESLPLAWAKALHGDFDNAALLDANYLRVPDAELALLAAQSRRMLEPTGVGE